jgi:membrane protein DedA with SNARE-associated domain
MEAFVLHNITTFTYSGIFMFLMLTVFGFPFPEDAVLLLSGAVVSQGVIRVMPTLCISYVGVLTGDLMLYYIGRRYGILIVTDRRFKRIVNEARMERAGRWFHKWGNSLVFFGRHLVGIRAQVFLCAGIFEISADRVLLYDALSALIGVPAMIYLGYLFGSNFHVLKEKVAFWQWLAVLVVIAAAAAFFVFRRLRRKNA